MLSVTADATVLLTQPSIAESAAHDRVISTLAQLHSLRYCPQVPNLALIMLSYLSEAEVFTAMVRLPPDYLAISFSCVLPEVLLSLRRRSS
jgi:hypothetical protein